MRILKWIVAVLIVLYALWSAMPAYFNTMFKLQPNYPMTGMEKYLPLMQSLSPVQIVVWWVAILLFLWAAWRVVRNERAFWVYATAFVLDIGGWLVMRLGPAYQRVFSPGEQTLDYVILVVLGVVASLVGTLDSFRPGARPIQT